MPFSDTPIIAATGWLENSPYFLHGAGLLRHIHRKPVFVQGESHRREFFEGYEAVQRNKLSCTREHHRIHFEFTDTCCRERIRSIKKVLDGALQRFWCELWLCVSEASAE
jgi:hypothetical protein